MKNTQVIAVVQARLCRLRVLLALSQVEEENNKLLHYENIKFLRLLACLSAVLTIRL